MLAAGAGIVLVERGGGPGVCATRGQADIGYERVAARAGEVAQTGTGAVGSTGQGQAVAHMGFEPVLISGRPCDLSGCASSANP